MKTHQKIAVFFSFIAVSFLLLVLVYALPAAPIKQHVNESISQFKIEGEYPLEYQGFPGSKRDNFTDALMLNIASDTSSESVLIRSAANYYRTYTGKPVISWLKIYKKAPKSETFVSYARYWHGYLVFLKPLLTVFNYQQIRMINYLVELLLILYLTLLLAKKGKRQFILPFLCVLTFFPLTVISKSLQFSTVFYPTIISLILITKWHSFFQAKQLYGLFFLLLGMTVNYIDLLTYPAVSLGFALCFYIMMEESAAAQSCLNLPLLPVRINPSALRTIHYSFAWLLGYAGMWASKWCISSLVLRQNIIKDAAASISFRTSDSFNGITWSYGDVLSKNLANISKTNLALAVLILIILFAVMLKKGLRPQLSALPKGCGFLLTAFIPFIWYFVLKNHSCIHNFFTYRNFSISLLALLFYITSVFQSRKTTAP